MPFIAREKRKGKVYLYVRHNHRVNGKSQRLWQIYLGPEERFKTNTKIALNLDVEAESIEFGLVAALLRVAKKLGVVELINQFTNKREQGLGVGEHVLLATLNRCVQPTSKTQLKGWVESTMLQRIYPDIEVALDSRAYWTHFQYLSGENIELIEDGIVRAVRKKYGIRFADLSFDPTNFYTYINPRKPNQTLPNHGHSKEGRATLNLVNLSLFCTLDGGIPLFHLAYPGNVQDANHFKTATRELEKRLKRLDIPLGTVTLTFDKGNLSPDGFALVDELKLDYICSDRPSTHKDLLDLAPEEFEMHELPNGKKVGVKDFHLAKYGQIRRFVAVYDPREATWKRENFEKKVAKKVAEIEKYFAKRLRFAPGEKRKGKGDKWRHRAEVEKKVEAMIGRKFKDVLVATVEGPAHLEVARGGRFKLSVATNAEAIDEAVLKLGKAFLMTSREDLAALEVVWAYRQQYLVERAFKWLKNATFLSIRPMYHRVDSSIRGHVFVCYLGLILLALLVYELTQLGVSTSIYQAVKHLKEIQVMRIFVPGKSAPVETLSRMSPKARELYDALKLDQYFKETR